MDVPKIKFIGDREFSLPGAKDPREDLPGYKKKPRLEKSPYVKDAQGMIWFWEPWMADMGDVLQSCWTAPPKPKVQVATAADVEHFGRRLPQKGEAAAPRKRGAAGAKRKKGGRKPKPMPYSKEPGADGNAAGTAG